MSKVLSRQEELALKQAADVVETTKTKGYTEIIEPFLLGKLNQSFPDPTQFKDDKEFLYAAKYASVYKKVVREIMDFIGKHDDALAALTAKKDKPEARLGGDL